MMSSVFSIWDASRPDERDAWLRLWALWPEREIFAHPSWVELNAGPEDRALCIAGSENGSYVLYPFLLRPLRRFQYCDPCWRDFCDIATPYGYGGPFRWGAPWQSSAATAFWATLEQWAARNRVVSEVIRFSLFPESMVEYNGEQRILRNNIVRVLGTDDELLHDCEHKVRKNVARARASGVRVWMDDCGSHLDEFLSLYLATMDRRHASASYYFPRDYFDNMHASLHGHFMYSHASVGDAVVSTELVLVSATRIYSFLGGTNPLWYRVRPNDLLKMEIMRWGRSAGKTAFVLGGGATREDGIYRYKLSFAPRGRVPFLLGTHVFDTEAYQQLTESRRNHAAASGVVWQPSPDYFPAYRS